MTKSTVPVDYSLRTKRARKGAAKAFFGRRTDYLGFASNWAHTIATALTVHVSVGSKRTNTKRVCPANVAEIHYRAEGLGYKRYLVATLTDGRVCFFEATWHGFDKASVDSGVPVPVHATAEAWVSHDLEHLWWYAIPEVARQAILLDIRVRDRARSHA